MSENSNIDLLKQHIEKTLQEDLPAEACHALEELVFEKSFDRKEFFVEPGRPCNYQYFIIKGSCYTYYINEKGDKNALQLALENYWVTDASSYFTNKPAVSTIETLEPTMVLMLNKANFYLLCEAHPLFDRYFRVLLQNALSTLYHRIAKTNSEDAEHRYLEFSKLNPHFIQRIPQYVIASYLGIKPQSLSRIRKELASKSIS